jgi:hypothetical protein
MAAMSMSSWAVAAEPTTPSGAPDDALSRLKADNERFTNSNESASKPVAARRAETAQGQTSNDWPPNRQTPKPHHRINM